MIHSVYNSYAKYILVAINCLEDLNKLLNVSIPDFKNNIYEILQFYDFFMNNLTLLVRITIKVFLHARSFYLNIKLYLINSLIIFFLDTMIVNKYH